MWQSFEEWMAQVPECMLRDPLWGFETYRKALFLADLAWYDTEKLLADARGKGVAWQLVDSAGSVPANLEEGYSRGFYGLRLVPLEKHAVGITVADMFSIVLSPSTV